MVNSKWVLRVNANAKGEVEKYKARVVEKGYIRVKVVDCDENFSPIVRFEYIRQMVAMGTLKGMEVHQMDVKIAFMYAPLKEEVSMEQPKGPVQPRDERKVMRLLK